MSDDTQRLATYHRVEAETALPAPYGSIQWKGTDVCMDIWCSCGGHSHLDAEFAYRLRCPHCGAVYHVGTYVRLVPALEGEILDGDFIEEPEPSDLGK